MAQLLNIFESGATYRVAFLGSPKPGQIAKHLFITRQYYEASLVPIKVVSTSHAEVLCLFFNADLDVWAETTFAFRPSELVVLED